MCGAARFLGPADFNNYVRVVYDALVRFSPDGAKIEPKIAAGWQSSSDFKTWTIRLRKGARWSDGTAFTADDIVFWYKDVILNKDLTPALPGWMRNADGTAASVEKVDAQTVRFTYKQPATLFLTALANQDGGDRTYAAFLPAHYLKKFHPEYTKKEDIDKLVQAAGFKTWTELFAAKNAPVREPGAADDGAPGSPVTRVSDQVFTLRRNPYFVGVDPDGNQLPYLDEVRFTFFADIQALNLAAIAGEFDMQERHIQMTNYPVFKENEKSGKYRVITWPTFGGADAVVAFNQSYKADPEIGKLLATKDFRVALSYAVNRDQIKESVFLGLGEPRQGVPAPWHPYFPGDEWAKKYTQYKPDEANKLLDGIGLTKKDAQGIRLLPNGKPVTIELSVVPAFAAWPDVAQLDREGLGEGRRQDASSRSGSARFTSRCATRTSSRPRCGTRTPPPSPSPATPRSTSRNNPILTIGPLFGQWYAEQGQGRHGAAARRSRRSWRSSTPRGRSAPTGRSRPPRRSSASGRTTSTRSGPWASRRWSRASSSSTRASATCPRRSATTGRSGARATRARSSSSSRGSRPPAAPGPAPRGGTGRGPAARPEPIPCLTTTRASGRRNPTTARIPMTRYALRRLALLPSSCSSSR